MKFKASPSPEHSFRCLAGLLVLAFGLAGCSCRQTIPPPENQVSDPVILFQLMEHRLDELHSARFRVISEIYSTQARGANLRQVVLVRQPQDLHIQILSPFDQTLSMMVANHQRLALYDMESNTFYQGSPSPENIALILPFYLTAADIVRLLLGGPPLDLCRPGMETSQLEWDSSLGAYKLSLELPSTNETVELWIRHGDWLLSAARHSGLDSARSFELRTGSFEDSGGFTLPTRLRFEMQGEDAVDMSLRVQSIDLNVDFPDHLFQLEPPPGSNLVELD